MEPVRSPRPANLARSTTGTPGRTTRPPPVRTRRGSGPRGAIGGRATHGLAHRWAAQRDASPRGGPFGAGVDRIGNVGGPVQPGSALVARTERGAPAPGEPPGGIGPGRCGPGRGEWPRVRYGEVGD